MTEEAKGIWTAVQIPWPHCEKCGKKMEYVYDNPGETQVTLMFKCSNGKPGDIGCQDSPTQMLHKVYDPNNILAPGNLGGFSSVCRNCGCRFPGAIGHGPPCGCQNVEKPDLTVEMIKLALPPKDRKLIEEVEEHRLHKIDPDLGICHDSECWICHRKISEDTLSIFEEGGCDSLVGEE